MKAARKLPMLLAASFATALSLTFFTSAASAESLKFLSWQDYIDPELVEKFEEQAGIDIVTQQYISNEQRDSMITESRGEGLDIILLNGLVLEKFVRKGWLAALPDGYTGELSMIDKQWWQAYQAAEWYAVPYFWGTLGIVYRSDLVDRPINSWGQLLQPSSSLRGKVSVLDSYRETLGMALKAKKYSLNTRRSAEMDDALGLLENHFADYQSHPPMDSLTTSKLISGNLHAAMMYSGSALTLQRLDTRIKYVVPKEGGSIWVDYLVVSAKSKNKQAAWDFIKFLNEPENATQLAYYLYYATTNNGAKAMLDDRFLSNKTIYPEKQALAKSEILRPMLSRHKRDLESRFNDIKAPAAN
ncbi:MAG: spermidine/putrescine ABC transporter substrate-binding protein [Candidatus Pelagadaptatus aseana]|uniref:polyamine ABC transporter substrate-binding protein n=1 Tax=Candidatus Pelagadaptatus aseana TaxID=3120508 RepID=UPI0039B2F193